MNKVTTSILALLFYLYSVGLADCSTDPLKAIADICMEQPVKLCEERVVGQGPAHDAFMLTVKLIKHQKKTMAMYESRFGAQEIERFNKLFNVKPVMPNFSDYSSRQISDKERSYSDKRGNQITLSKMTGTWIIDMDKSRLKTSPSREEIRMLRILLGFYHDLQNRLEQRQSLDVVEQATLLAFAGIFYHDIPPGRPEKEQFRKFLARNAATPEEVQHKYLTIADKL
jgi:hypothetical protein